MHKETYRLSGSLSDSQNERDQRMGPDNGSEGVSADAGPGTPIPTQVPKPLDLSRLPEQVLRSGAVEALIQQNEDLMSRLAVSLRRISDLEEQVNTVRQSSEKLHFYYQNAKDQALVLEEKARLMQERKERAEGQFSEMRQRIQMLEVQSAELYTKSKERQQEHSERVRELSRRLKRHLRYRNKIQTASKSLREKSQLEQSRWTEERLSLLDEQQRLRDSWQKEADELRGQIELQKSRVSDLQQKLTESTTYIQEQSKQAQKDQSQLVEQYEAQVSKLQGELEGLQREQDRLLSKNQQLEELYDQNVELENKLVFHQRRAQDKETSLNKEILQLQEGLSHYRSEAKTQSLKVTHLEEQLQEEVLTKKSLDKAKRQLEDQVESLQCLWKENQQQIEEQKVKVQSLQKLNQQLSTKLNEYRVDIRRLQNSVREKTSAFDKKSSPSSQTTTEWSQVEARVKPKEVKTDNLIKKDSGKSTKILHELETLLSEIESGFNSHPKV